MKTTTHCLRLSSAMESGEPGCDGNSWRLATRWLNHDLPSALCRPLIESRSPVVGWCASDSSETEREKLRPEGETRETEGVIERGCLLCLGKLGIRILNVREIISFVINFFFLRQLLLIIFIPHKYHINY